MITSQGILTLIGGILIHVMGGCMYLTGYFNIYVVSYLRRWD